MKKILVLSAAFCLIVTSAFSQNLDPTVIVNKTYEGKLIEVRKPSFEMAVPDSVSQFALDFDYLVFEKPYKGADGFSPYIFDMKPVTEPYEPKSFYLNAGAGYTLHPELDLVWSPYLGDSFKVDVYGMHRSYVGKYYDDWSGYDMKSVAGINARLERRVFATGFDVSYYGLASKDFSKRRMYDALDASLYLKSKPADEKAFLYDVRAAYRLAGDKLHYLASDAGVGEHNLNVDAVAGKAFRRGHKVTVDLSFEMDVYNSSWYSGRVGQVTVAPHYMYSKGRFYVDAGLKISKLLKDKGNLSMFRATGQLLYPDVKAAFALIPDAMRLYAHVGGGNMINTYASLLERNHHVDPTFGLESGLMDVTVERISAAIGLEGRIGARFVYDLRAGYVNYAEAMLDAVYPSVEGQLCLPGVGYSPYSKYFAALDWKMNLPSWRFDGNVTYTHAWGADETSGLFLPAALAGDVAFGYDWRQRVFAGVDCEFSTARHSSLYMIPAYADLGVTAEYVVNRMVSVWARGGNLLNMAIMRNPCYAEKGVSCTVGICLNL